LKLIFLHGPPASGKYTIARVLRASYGVLNFHNHLTLDVAKSLFDFGTPEFWELTHRLRRAAVATRAEHGDATVVFTNCYSSPHDDATVAALEHAVFLECSLEELRRRVTEPSRQEMRKLRSVEGLEEYIAAWNFVALDRPNTISVRTDARSPEECAEEIARRTL
jgi:shikimate kinase